MSTLRPSSTRLAAPTSLASGPTTTNRAIAMSRIISPVAIAVEVSSAVFLRRVMAVFSGASENAVARTPTSFPFGSRMGATGTTRSGSRRSASHLEPR